MAQTQKIFYQQIKEEDIPKESMGGHNFNVIYKCPKCYSIYQGKNTFFDGGDKTAIRFCSCCNSFEQCPNVIVTYRNMQVIA